MNNLMNNQNNLNVNTKRFKCVGLLFLLTILTGFNYCKAMQEEEMVQRKISQEDANKMLFDAKTPEKVDEALKAGANINTPTFLSPAFKGWTALHINCWRGLTKVALKLIENGANIHATVAACGNYTPLQFACIRNKKEVVKLLLENGANPDFTSQKNKTPAQLTNDEEIREMLNLISNYIKEKNISENDGNKFIEAQKLQKNVELLLKFKNAISKKQPFKLPERTDKYHDMNVIAEKEKLERNEN